MINEEYSVYSINTIIYIIASFLLIGVGLFLIKKYVKSEKANYWIVKSTGLVLFIMIIVNKAVTVPYFDNNWWMIIPESFCALSAFFLGLFVVLGKPNNIALHAFTYFAFVGGLFASVYPNYLSFLPFWSARAFTGLLHHSIMIFLTLLMFLNGYLKPTIKRWYVSPLAYLSLVVFGLFEIQVLKHPDDTMSIYEPLLPSLPYLTSWWMLGIGICLLIFIFLIFYEHFTNKKTIKQIFLEMKI